MFSIMVAIIYYLPFLGIQALVKMLGVDLFQYGLGYVAIAFAGIGYFQGRQMSRFVFDDNLEPWKAYLYSCYFLRDQVKEIMKKLPLVGSLFVIEDEDSYSAK